MYIGGSRIQFLNVLIYVGRQGRYVYRYWTNLLYCMYLEFAIAKLGTESPPDLRGKQLNYAM